MSTPSIPTYSIDSFDVGDYVVFERRFTQLDFDAFSKLSGDTNPLHHDADFAGKSVFGKPIVPLHITLSPLSMIAGTVFPGEQSLYLSHEVRASQPVYYGDVLRYSARVENVNSSQRVLSLRVLVLRESDVVLDATMLVRSQVLSWTTPPALAIYKGARPSLAVVSGGTGEIGSAIAVALARQGWRLLIQDRGDGQRRRHLQNQLARIQAEAIFVCADLASDTGCDTLAEAIQNADELGLIVHAASPRITEPVEQLVAVNFSALKRIVDVSLPKLLMRQKASIVLIGSNATEYALAGWEAYAGAKSMAANLVDALERRYAMYGVRGLTLMPGLVNTSFSSEYRGDRQSLLPQEVAEALVQMLDDQADGNVMILEPGRCRRGRRVFQETNAAILASHNALAISLPASGGDAKQTSTSPVDSVLRKCLRLMSTADLSNAGLGLTPGWDSLKHIGVLLALETALGIRFSSTEIEKTHNYSQLDVLCRTKIAERSV
jgi:NADP-dependent 3-hydroxy acid dehydrogenase YdfG/acyl dehydratase/acyl carrier protein